MLNTRKTTTGKIYAPIDQIKTWDKNPRQIDRPEDFERLKRQLLDLGQYKPLLVTEDGIVIGGNMRLKAMAELFNAGNKNFEEVWVTELSFGEVERTHEEITAGKPVEYRVLIDGKLQDRQFESVEQIMIEYALSDNDAIGTYNQNELSELIHPYQELIPQGNYKLTLAPEVKLETFMDQYQPDKNGDAPGLDPQDDEKKSKYIVMKLQFTPDQFAEVEPQIENIKKKFGVENNSDLLTRLLDLAEQATAMADDVVMVANAKEEAANFQNAVTEATDENMQQEQQEMAESTTPVDNTNTTETNQEVAVNG